MKKNKKGAEMTIGTIIVIILALVVLVVIIYGFTTGWSNLWQKIIGFGGGSSNIQTMVQACQLACTSASNYDYCSLQRDVVFAANDVKNGKYNCRALESMSVGLDPCSSMTNCNAINKPANQIKCSDLLGTWQTAVCKSGSDLTGQVKDNSDQGGSKYCCADSCIQLSISGKTGSWQTAACDTNTQTDMTSQASDKSTKPASTPYCCVPKA